VTFAAENCAGVQRNVCSLNIICNQARGADRIRMPTVHATLLRGRAFSWRTTTRKAYAGHLGAPSTSPQKPGAVTSNCTTTWAAFSRTAAGAPLSNRPEEGSRLEACMLPLGLQDACLPSCFRQRLNGPTQNTNGIMMISIMTKAVGNPSAADVPVVAAHRKRISPRIWREFCFCPPFCARSVQARKNNWETVLVE
jgi:hypothetical protein